MTASEAFSIQPPNLLNLRIGLSDYEKSAVIRAFLFDMDGVIVDSLHYHYLAWAHMFKELHHEVSEHTVLLHEGRASREILPLLLEEAGVSLPDHEHERFIERKREYYRSIVEVAYFPNAFEVIATLRERRYRIALVTASALRNMQASIPEERRSFFDFIVTGDEVKNAKPDPEPYLTAMRHLGLTPKECVVVENAPLGIASAKNAGMTCVAVETTLSREYLTGADYIIHKLDELPELPFLFHRNQ